jgi:inner membrane protein
VDNLTHSLIGAVIGQAGLKRRTGLAMPALIIAANIPDIDAGCAIYGLESLAMRRGITHGPIAMLVLPLALAGALWWFDKWQARRGTRPERRLPVNFRWLYLLGLIACLTHPAFDWLNNYGIRLLEPVSSQWFYGDTLFIIDPWLWAMLGGGLWISLRRERAGKPHWPRAAQAAIAAGLAYTGMNYAVARQAETLAAGDVPFAETNVANAVPVAFWRRDVLWRTDSGIYGTIPCTMLACDRYPLEMRKANINRERLARSARSDPAARAFLFWSRMPVVVNSKVGPVLMDQRFMDPRIGDRFSVTLRPPA